MNRTHILVFASVLFLASPPAFAQSKDASADADADAGADASTTSKGGSGSGGSQGSGGAATVTAIGAEPREYDLVENDTKACSVTSPGRARGGMTTLVVAAVLGAEVVRRRSRRR